MKTTHHTTRATRATRITATALCLFALFALAPVPTLHASDSTTITITTQPASVTVTEGATATFTIAAASTAAPAPNGSSTLTYQWRAGQPSKNGTFLWSDIPGATTPTLTLTNVTKSKEGFKYDCHLKDRNGTKSSAIATLTVNFPPIIARNTSPSSATITAGQNASFDIRVIANPAATYQWQSSTDGNTWSNLANAAPYATDTPPAQGAAAAALYITAAPATLNGVKYRCVVTNPLGAATSNPATLTVTSTRSLRSVRPPLPKK